jgi:type I restriction enzyme S subunit
MTDSPLKLRVSASNWDVLPLKHVSKFIKDGTHGTHKRVEVGIPLLSAKNISSFGGITIDADDSLISETEYRKIHSSYELKMGDLLITVVGTLGRRALVRSEKKFSIQRSIGVVRCETAKIEPNFLYQFTGTDYFQNQLILRSNATAQAGVYLGELAKIEVPCPPPPRTTKNRYHPVIRR